VNVPLTLTLFALGAGAIALWLEVRFAHLAPATRRGIALHIGACILVAQLVVPFGMHTLSSAGSRVLTLVGVCGVALPGLTYCLLTAIWVIKMLRDDPRGLIR